MELKDQLMQQIDRERLPQHIAIIMDGNGRWAKERGKQRLFGHQSAIQSVREVSEASAEIGVKLSLSKHMAATVEWRMQKTFTDYLDDVGTVYPEQHALFTAEDGVTYDLSDPTGNYLAGQQRGNAAFNDWFGMARVSLTWKFNLPDRRGCNLSKF